MFQDITGEYEREGGRREGGAMCKENILPTFEYPTSAKGTRDPHYADGASRSLSESLFRNIILSYRG